MPLFARCSHCSHDFMYPQVAAGRMGPCPKCRKQTLLGPGDGTTYVPPAPPPASPPAPTASGVAPPPVPTLRPGVMIGNRYLLDAELGRGAFGVVYRAFDIELARKPVAIKVLLPEALATPEAVTRFRKELQVLYRVEHANVPAVLGQGEYAGQQYIVLAFVRGKTVREMIPQGGFEDPVAAVKLVTKLVRTLHDIYADGKILHRDVKPANMMVPDGQTDGLYLMDFGLAVCHDQSQRVDGERTQEGTRLGTPLYMSPEQAAGEISSISHASDIYSTGVVLYHLLTGRPPFTSGWPMIAAEIIMKQPDPPSYLRPDIDPELDAIVLKALNKKPIDRYATGAEFAQELELWVAHALVGSSGRGGHTGQRPPLPPGTPPSGPLRRPGTGDTSVVNNGETLDNPPSRTRAGSRLQGPAPASVVVVRPVNEGGSSGLLLKVLAGVAIVAALAIGIFAIVNSNKSEPSTPTKQQNSGKAWER